MFRRFDIGWKDPSGNHGLIAAHDGELAVDEATPLYQWTDLTRAPFRTHWFFVALTGATLALIRVTPVDGGTRGTASYSHALLFARTAVHWGTDLAELLEVFPALPQRIGQPSTWKRDVAPQAPLHRLTGRELTASPGLLAAMFTTALPLTQCEIVAGGSLDQETQIGIALRSYALLPQILQACGLSFATSAAPGFASPFFGFGTEERSERGGRELAAFWLSLQDRLRPELLSVIDARSPTALFESVAHALVMRLGATLPERVDQLVQLLLAVPFGALDDAKFSAVERALLRLEGHAKGSLLMTLVQRLEAQPVPGAHSLWILRLLGDPAALAALSPSERAPVLLRFFKALPGELLRILPQLLDASLSTDLVNALCSALNAFAFSAARLPAGFAALAEDVLRVGLSPDEVVPDERGQGTLVTALALIQELLERREQAGDLARLAVQLADGVVAEASWFAAHLLALAKVLKQLRGGVPASPRRSIYFLLHTSCAQTYNERYAVQGLLDALIFAHGNGRSPEGAGQILDALQVALSEEDQLWIPMMRQCLFPTLSGRTHGSTH